MLELVVRDTRERRNGAIVGLWRCECGKEVKVKNLSANKYTNSCGCSRYRGRDKTKHPYYSIWRGVKQRCYNKKSYSF